MTAARAIGLGALSAALVLVPCAAPRADSSLEYPVKAAFLYKFGSYVDWPPTAFAGSRAPVVVCVVGHDPFGVLLDRTVRDETINDRPVVVRRLRTAAPGAPCHIAYLGGSREQPAEAAAAILAGSPVLTVSDDAAGSVIRFRIVNNRVRFEIDLGVAEAGGMTISSKLLNLALAVIR